MGNHQAVTAALPPERRITYRSIMCVDPEENDLGPVPGTSLDRELAGLRDQMARLTSENARLLRLLELTPAQARPPGPAQTGIFDGPPGVVGATSSPETKIAFFASMFAARSDVYAVRWENARTGRSGWMPAVRGGHPSRPAGAGVLPTNRIDIAACREHRREKGNLRLWRRGGAHHSRRAVEDPRLRRPRWTRLGWR